MLSTQQPSPDKRDSPLEHLLASLGTYIGNACMNEPGKLSFFQQ